MSYIGNIDICIDWYELLKFVKPSSMDYILVAKAAKLVHPVRPIICAKDLLICDLYNY